MKKIIKLLLLLLSTFLFAQNEYKLDTIDKEKRTQFIKYFEESNDLLLDQISDKYNSKIARELKTNLKEFKKRI
jgi:hypothetical protein